MPSEVPQHAQELAPKQNFQSFPVIGRTHQGVYALAVMLFAQSGAAGAEQSPRPTDVLLAKPTAVAQREKQATFEKFLEQFLGGDEKVSAGAMEKLKQIPADHREAIVRALVAGIQNGRPPIPRRCLALLAELPPCEVPELAYWVLGAMTDPANERVGEIILRKLQPEKDYTFTILLLMAQESDDSPSSRVCRDIVQSVAEKPSQKQASTLMRVLVDVRGDAEDIHPTNRTLMQKLVTSAPWLLLPLLEEEKRWRFFALAQLIQNRLPAAKDVLLPRIVHPEALRDDELDLTLAALSSCGASFSEIYGTHVAVLEKDGPIDQGVLDQKRQAVRILARMDLHAPTAKDALTSLHQTATSQPRMGEKGDPPLTKQWTTVRKEAVRGLARGLQGPDSMQSFTVDALLNVLDYTPDIRLEALDALTAPDPRRIPRVNKRVQELLRSSGITYPEIPLCLRDPASRKLEALERLVQEQPNAAAILYIIHILDEHISRGELGAKSLLKQIEAKAPRDQSLEATNVLRRYDQHRQ